MATTTVSDTDRIAVLIRIYRAAKVSGDTSLAESAARELRSLGIEIGGKHE